MYIYFHKISDFDTNHKFSLRILKTIRNQLKSYKITKRGYVKYKHYKKNKKMKIKKVESKKLFCLNEKHFWESYGSDNEDIPRWDDEAIKFTHKIKMFCINEKDLEKLKLNQVYKYNYYETYSKFYPIIKNIEIIDKENIILNNLKFEFDKKTKTWQSYSCSFTQEYLTILDFSGYLENFDRMEKFIKRQKIEDKQREEQRRIDLEEWRRNNPSTGLSNSLVRLATCRF